MGEGDDVVEMSTESRCSLISRSFAPFRLTHGSYSHAPSYNQQYTHVYSPRLRELRGLCLRGVEGKVEERVIDCKEGVRTAVVGTIFKDVGADVQGEEGLVRRPGKRFFFLYGFFFYFCRSTFAD